MLACAYPNGVGDDYLAVLALLHDHMSDRNLAEAMSFVTGNAEELVLNDIYAARSTQPPSHDEMMRARKILVRHGYLRWQTVE
ncbi:MAG: hypothetical protein NVS3B20_11640 [Polyangiales bacterium]